MRPFASKTMLALLAAIATVEVSGSGAKAASSVWTGPFTGTSDFFSSTSSWSTNTAPISDPSTQLIFPGSDAQSYNAVNDIGSPFVANGLIYNTWSTGTITTSSNNVSNGSFALELNGSSPRISINGPGQVNIGGFKNNQNAYPIILAPASGATTIGGSGTGTILLGNYQAAVYSTGDLAVNLNGYQQLVLDSPSGQSGGNPFGGGSSTNPVANTINGTVYLNSGVLFLESTDGMGTAPLVVNGGMLQQTGGETSSTNITANADLVLFSGSAAGTNNITLSGSIAGSGGVRLTGQTQNFTLTNSDTYNGATTIDPAPVSSIKASTLTIGAGGSITSTAPITIGHAGGLGLNAGNPNAGMPATTPLNFIAGYLSITPSTSNSLANLGGFNASGFNTFTFSQLSGNATNTFSFGTTTLNNNAMLFFRGNWPGTANSSYVLGQANFSGGLAMVSDSALVGTSQQVVAFASGSSNASSTAPNAFVTYNSSGVGLIGTTDSTQVVQFGSLANSFSSLPAGDSYVNFNAASGSYSLSGNAQVYALSTSGATTISGAGQLNVSSGAVVLGSALTLKGPTLAFGSRTGYVHAGATFSVTGGSITGTNGLVLGGLGTAVQFSDLGTNTDSSNPFAGGLTLNDVTVSYTNDLQLGAVGGGITLNGGMLVYNGNVSGGSLAISRPIALGPAGGGIYSTDTNATGISVNSTITGPGGFYLTNNILSTSFVTTLTGTNSYTGPTFVGLTSAVGVNLATLNVSSDANMGSVTAPLDLDGGTLQFGSSATFQKSITLLASSTIDTNGNSPAINGVITPLQMFQTTITTVPTLTKVGLGTLTLSANQTLLSGNLQINAGTLALAGAAGALPDIQSVTVGAGAALQIDDSVTNLSNRYADAGKVLLAGGTLNFIGNASGSSETFGSLTLSTGPGTVTVNPANAVLTSSGTTSGSTLLNKTGVGTLILSSVSSYTGGANISAGILKVDIANSTNASFGAITVQSGATLQLAAIGTGTNPPSTNPRGVLVASSFTDAGTVDIQTNGLDLPGASLGTINPLVGEGYNGGTWHGVGITSSTAAANSTHLTAVGVISNDNGQGGSLYGVGGTVGSSFDGTSPGYQDVLVKYTYYGDTDLNGYIDGTDYCRIDNAYLGNQTHPGKYTGWYNGDFNYDGVVDGSDYTLIDNAFNTQGASLAAEIASPTAEIASPVSSVPEPVSMGLLVGGVVVIEKLGRRPRR